MPDIYDPSAGQFGVVANPWTGKGPQPWDQAWKAAQDAQGATSWWEKLAYMAPFAAAIGPAAFSGGGAAAGGSVGADVATEAAAGMAGGGAGVGTGAAIHAASAVPWGQVVSSGAGLFGSLFSAKMQSDAAQKAAELGSAANQAALTFSKAGAENQYQNSEVARKANYDQWAAAQRRIASIASYLGVPGSREIPAYVPGVDPNFTGAPSVANSLNTAASPSAAGGYQPLVAALNGGQTPQAVIAQFNASQGLPNGASYAWRSIPNAPGGGVVEIPGGAYLAPGPDGKWGYTAAPTSAGLAAAPRSVASYMPIPVSPGLTMPNPYAVSSYFG